MKDPFSSSQEETLYGLFSDLNQYTELDGYPLPQIDDMVNTLAKYKLFSTFDLKTAYHQVSIKGYDMKYTGFEANGRLYLFCCLPFGVTNGFAVFKRPWKKLLKKD